MRTFIQCQSHETTHIADCVTVCIGDLTISISPEGMELSLVGDDESSPMWVELGDLIKLAKGER